MHFICKLGFGALVVFLAVVIVGPVYLQSAGNGQMLQQRQGEVDKREVIKLETTLIQVPVTVSDRGGRYIIDLQVKDFEIYEDGVKQDIGFFRSIEEPFSVVLALDCSGSTKDQLEKIKEGAISFIKSLRPGDKAMIMAFDDSVSMLSGMTDDQVILSEAVRRIVPGEYSQVYEAVYTAVWEQLDLVEGRKAMILFSDGIDTASSEINQEDTLDAVVESEDVVVYCIRYDTRKDVEHRLESKVGPDLTGERRLKLDRTYRAADEYLFKLAELSGGVVERVDEFVDVETAFARISEELRHQYLLGYYPINPRKGDERRIRVQVKRQDVRVRVRPGFSL
jgi:VWFA-related protein